MRSSEKQGDELKALVLPIKPLHVHFLPLNGGVWPVSCCLVVPQHQHEPARSHQGLPTGFSCEGVISSPDNTKPRSAYEHPLL